VAIRIYAAAMAEAGRETGPLGETKLSGAVAADLFTAGNVDSLPRGGVGGSTELAELLLIRAVSAAGEKDGDDIGGGDATNTGSRSAMAQLDASAALDMFAVCLGKDHPMFVNAAQQLAAAGLGCSDT
jgi:hypothetical protein